MKPIAPRPGSFLWLVVHDLRLNWRRFVDMLGRATPGQALLFATVGGIVLHALAWPAVPYLAPHVDAAQTAGESRLLIAGLLIAVASWMTAQGLFASTRALYDRGDLDLLLGAPISPRRVLAAKATAIALSSLGSVAMLALPVANVGALRYGPHWLAVYPTLAGIALLATAIALALAIWLFHLFGPRKARLYAQLTGAVIGGAFVLVAQIIAMLPEPMRRAVSQALMPVDAGSVADTEASLWSQVIGLPVDAVLGDRLAMLVVLACGVTAFVMAAALLGARFAEASLEAAGAPGGGSGNTGQRLVRFHASAGSALRRKEWRLLLRDPSLFAQLGLQIVYTIPLAVVLVRSGSLPIGLALTPAIVVITAQVAASLAWIAVSGEDAPELIASAPVAPSAVDRAKLSAIALPVIAVSAVPVAGLALVAPGAALVALLFAGGASISTALLNLWHPMPGNRRGMLRRHAQSKLVGLIEHVLAILWAIAAVLALLGTQLWLVPLGLAFGVLWYVRWAGRGEIASSHAASAAPAAAR